MALTPEQQAKIVRMAQLETYNEEIQKWVNEHDDNTTYSLSNKDGKIVLSGSDGSETSAEGGSGDVNKIEKVKVKVNNIAYDLPITASDKSVTMELKLDNSTSQFQVDGLSKSITLPPFVEFKGTVGSQGVVSALPNARASKGFMYYSIEKGYYDGAEKPAGTIYISDGRYWHGFGSETLKYENGYLSLITSSGVEMSKIPLPAGQQGPKGDKGDKGDQGETGPQGPVGPQGETGEQGPQGEKGDKGDKGNAFTYEDFTPEQLESLRGPQGIQGIQGEQGPQGIQGVPGEQGIKGDKGDGFSIFKTYPSISDMEADASNVEEGKFVLITSTVEDPDNAKLYVKNGEGSFTFQTDMSGATGIQGPKGDTGSQGDVGPQGPQGIQGVQGPIGPEGTPGVSCEHSWDGTTLTITSASGTSSADLKGPKGDDAVLPEPVASITENDITNWNSKADSSAIPTKVSELENDANYASGNFLPISGGSSKPMTGPIYSQHIVPTEPGTYNLGSTTAPYGDIRTNQITFYDSDTKSCGTLYAYNSSDLNKGYTILSLGNSVSLGPWIPNQGGETDYSPERRDRYGILRLYSTQHGNDIGEESGKYYTQISPSDLSQTSNVNLKLPNHNGAFVYTSTSNLKPNAVGSVSKPVYIDDNGQVQACSKTLAADVPEDAVFTDTKNTAGTTNSDNKLFLAGATSQGSNPRTYSNSKVYTQAGRLYCDGMNFANGPYFVANGQDFKLIMSSADTNYGFNMAVVNSNWVLAPLVKKTNIYEYLGNSSRPWKSGAVETAFTVTSDRNAKKDIKDIDEKYIELFKLLMPVSYMFKTGDRTHIGFISQDVEEAMFKVGLTDLDFAGFCKDIKIDEENNPIYDENGNPEYIYSLRYEEFIALNTAMIQKLSSKVESLEERLQRLEDKLN